LHLPDGKYHWQMRLHGDRGVSPWVAQARTIQIDTTPPTISQVTSPTNPTPGKTYHSSTVRFDWQAIDSGAGVEGYSYRLDGDAKGEARPEVRTSQPTVTLNGLDSGAWYMHVRALDNAGNWGPSVTFPIRVDVTPPGLAHVRFSLFQFDPQFNPLHISFQVTRPATSLRVGVYRQRDNAEVRLMKLDSLAKGQAATISWDGKDNHGALVPSGTYSVYIRAIDQYGHSSLSGWKDFVVDYRHILVSLSQQKLWAYDGNHLILSSLVTTGNKELPTPTGVFHVLGKFHPFTFHSPWPKSSPFYYAPSKTEYAMLFKEGGYFIHDAPWRSVFGPGSNAAVGTPGQNFTGTHGCVNVPANIAQRLFGWVRIGTIVQVVP
jgi:lipoprotein-anchoring transpeptidase ErfK/SrfK